MNSKKSNLSEWFYLLRVFLSYSLYNLDSIQNHADLTVCYYFYIFLSSVNYSGYNLTITFLSNTCICKPSFRPALGTFYTFNSKNLDIWIKDSNNTYGFSRFGPKVSWKNRLGQEIDGLLLFLIVIIEKLLLSIDTIIQTSCSTT